VRPRISLESLVLRDDLSDSHTVAEVAGEDTEGLVFGLTSALAALALSISSAHLTMLAGRARHTFYLTTADGHRLSSQEAQQAQAALLDLSAAS
jgi:[protein-PII] uridylyltransferase